MRESMLAFNGLATNYQDDNGEGNDERDDAGIECRIRSERLQLVMYQIVVAQKRYKQHNEVIEEMGDNRSPQRAAVKEDIAQSRAQKQAWDERKELHVDCREYER